MIPVADTNIIFSVLLKRLIVEYSCIQEPVIVTAYVPEKRYRINYQIRKR